MPVIPAVSSSVAATPVVSPAPYLSINYEEVYAVDPRNYQGRIADLVRDRGIYDVIILNYTDAFMSDPVIDGLRRLAGN
ncbi:MAG: hypothetical protein GX900_01290 [Clostridiaceae bacterium]|nr:hypothetical protein [Clostridiaceae bacterium]